MQMTAERQIPYLVFMLALSLYAVIALAVSTFAPLSPDTATVLDYADTAVCLLFFIDFLVTLARAQNRWKYLVTWGWIDLISSIPAIDVLRWGRAARALRILRVLRCIKAAKILSEFVLRRRAQNTFLAALLLSILLIVISASAVLQFETQPEANIRTPEDALWWAVVTVTTVGYGDRFPISSEGRLIGILLMTAGVGLFGTFSGLVAAWFLEASETRPEELHAIEKLEQEVRALREELERHVQRSS
jgi:voltage-gated potassium channel